MVSLKCIEHLLVAYGDQLGYHHGAKLQILKCWDKWYSRAESCVCVVTDKPELFESYPVRVLALDESRIKNWSLDNRQHFGIKMKAVQWALNTSPASKILLLDTDMYWRKDPAKLTSLIDDTTMIMFKDEGYVERSSNKSIQQFERALREKRVQWGQDYYQLSPNSKMFGSAVLGLSTKHSPLLDQAFSLFETLEPRIEAHTVEQFALAEIFRINGMTISLAHSSVKHWSSIGRKEYVTPILKTFFSTHGETDFETHLIEAKHVRISRPIAVVVKQKFLRWQTK